MNSQKQAAANRRLFENEMPKELTTDTAATSTQMSSLTLDTEWNSCVPAKYEDIELLQKEISELEEKLARLPTEQAKKTREVQRKIDEVFDKRKERMIESMQREYERLVNSEDEKTIRILTEISEQKTALLEKELK